MVWGRLRRLYGLQQHIRRRTGQDPLASFSRSDVLMMLCPPPSEMTATPQLISNTKRSAREEALIEQRAVPRLASWEAHMGERAGESEIYNRTQEPDMYVPSGKQDRTLKQRLRVTWPEDRLMWEYFRKHPEARLLPYDINSFDPPFVKRFALRQHELMQGGLNKAEAYAAVSKEMEPEKQETLRKVQGFEHLQSYSAIDLVQEQEEQHLQAGLQEFHGKRA